MVTEMYLPFSWQWLKGYWVASFNFPGMVAEWWLKCTCHSVDSDWNVTVFTEWWRFVLWIPFYDKSWILKTYSNPNLHGSIQNKVNFARLFGKRCHSRYRNPIKRLKIPDSIWHSKVYHVILCQLIQNSNYIVCIMRSFHKLFFDQNESFAF